MGSRKVRKLQWRHRIIMKNGHFQDVFGGQLHERLSKKGNIRRSHREASKYGPKKKGIKQYSGQDDGEDEPYPSDPISEIPLGPKIISDSDVLVFKRPRSFNPFRVGEAGRKVGFVTWPCFSKWDSIAWRIRSRYASEHTLQLFSWKMMH